MTWDRLVQRTGKYCFQKNCFQAANQYVFWAEKSFCFSTKRLCFVACWFSFTFGWNDRFKIKLRSDAFLKFLFKIRLKRKTNLMQACSANQHQVIMPSWLRKNALCLSQSAFSNFALHVIKIPNIPQQSHVYHKPRAATPNPKEKPPVFLQYFVASQRFDTRPIP